MGGWVSQVCAVFVALTLLASTASDAQVPDRISRELSRQLAESGQLLARTGYSRAAGPFAGALAPRQSRRYPLTLRANQDYRVIAVCDSRCSDIDLRLFDPSGNEITRDVLNDSVPTLAIRPSTTGQHTIEVDMYQCAAAPDPCWYAFNVYTR